MEDIFWIIFLVLCVVGGIVSAVFKDINTSQKMKTIKKTIIVSADSKKKIGSAIARGAIGGTILGPVGFVGGAISGKNKNSTTFLIEYTNGERETKIVENNSPEFEKLCKFLEM